MPTRKKSGKTIGRIHQSTSAVHLSSSYLHQLFFQLNMILTPFGIAKHTMILYGYPIIYETDVPMIRFYPFCTNRFQYSISLFKILSQVDI